MELPILARRCYWDFPRLFIVAYAGEHFLFECAFDDDLDDYPDEFHVFRMPPVSGQELEGSWENISSLAIDCLGAIPASDIRFDQTRRQSIDSVVLETLLAQRTPISSRVN